MSAVVDDATGSSRAIVAQRTMDVPAPETREGTNRMAALSLGDTEE